MNLFYVDNIMIMMYGDDVFMFHDGFLFFSFSSCGL